MPAPVNTDLASSNLIPGIYAQFQTNGGSGVDDASKRSMLIGTRLATGSGAPNTPVLFTSQADVDTAHGQGSEIARLYAAHVAQNGPGALEVWCVGVNPPTGVAATQLITTAGTASSAGYVDVYVCGRKVSVGIANGDTAATVGTAITAAITADPDMPCTAAGTTTCTLSYRHTGLSGNDMPVRVDQFGATGITFSPGTATFTGTEGTGSAVASLVIGATTVTITNTNGDTATVSGDALVAALAAGDYPVTGSNSTGAVTLLYRKGRYVRRIGASIAGGTVQTFATSAGTLGSGQPSLTTALTNISALNKGFSGWVTSLLDPIGNSSYNTTPTVAASPTMTAVDSIYSTLQTDCNGVNQKPAMVFIASPAKLSNAGAMVTAASPDLTTTSPFARFSLDWCRESAVQAFEVAARDCADYLFRDYQAVNRDGTVLKTRGTSAFLAPANADIPPQPDVNSAMVSYYMTPISVDSTGQIVVVRSMTTSNASNADLRETSTIRQCDTFRRDLIAYLVALFSGKSYRSSTPKTPNTVTTRSVKDAAFLFIKSMDDQDRFDDADAWKDAIVCNVNAINNTRFDLFVPLALIRNLHQIGAVVTPQ